MGGPGSSKRKRSNSTSGNYRAKPTRNDQMLLKMMERKIARSVEKKGVDGTFTSSPTLSSLNTNGQSWYLNLIGQGTASHQRVGRLVNLKSLRVRGTYALATDINSNAIRMTVVWDKTPSGGNPPVWEEIFGHTNDDGSEGAFITDSVRYDNMQRFKVLRDTYVPLTAGFYPATPTTGLSTIAAVKTFDEYIDLRGLTTSFNDTSTLPVNASITTGGLYLYFRAYHQSTDNFVTASGSWRLRFTD